MLSWLSNVCCCKASSAVIPMKESDVPEVVKILPIKDAEGNPRNKIALKPGHSLMDWVKLTNSGKNLAGVDKFMNVSHEELAKHASPNDVWVALRGNIYNVTHYMDFHPGGCEELMRGAGKDCTDLFDEVHRWVNYESMLKKCIVGKLKPSVDNLSSGAFDLNQKLRQDLAGTFRPPKLKTTDSSEIRNISFDWHESPGTVEISIFTKVSGNRLTKGHVIVDNDGKSLDVFVYTPSKARNRSLHRLRVKLRDNVERKSTVNVSSSSGKVTLFFKKIVRDHWGTIGDAKLESPCVDKPEQCFRTATLEKVTGVTHDMKVFEFVLPPGCFLAPPLGHHVFLKTDVLGMSVVKAYTPILENVNDMESDARLLCGSKLHLMIKIYPDGALTPSLDNLKPGQRIEVSNHDGNFEPESFWAAENIAFIAAGSGISPMIRLLAELFAGKEDLGKKKNSIRLLACNKTEADIPWADVIEEWTEAYDNFSVKHVLSRPDADWQGPKGRINEEILKGFLVEWDEANDRSVLICVCGSSAFNDVVRKMLLNIGFKAGELFLFDG